MRIQSEQRSFSSELENYLTSSGVGWTDLIFTEGWEDPPDVSSPQVNTYVIDVNPIELQLGRLSDRLFSRIVQVDVLMETKNRVTAICEDITDFMDITSVSIKDENDQLLGTLNCYDSQSIKSVFMPPIMQDPQILRWRGIVRGNFQAHYPNGGSPL